MRRREATGRRAAWTVALLACCVSPAVGQVFRGRILVQPGAGIQIGGEDEKPAASDERQSFAIDRDVSQAMRDAQRLLAESRFAEALPILQKVLDLPKDSFFNPSPTDRALYRSVKTEALDLIGGLPAEGRRLYELQFGATARALLDEAGETADLRQVEEVARRFFHSKAGYEAAYLLGVQHLDRLEPLAAALWFEQLRRIPEAARDREPLLSLRTAASWGRVGMMDQSLTVLRDLKRTVGSERLVFGGRAHQMFERDDQAIAWLVDVLGGQRGFEQLHEERWTMFRGNPSRTGLGSQVSPLWTPVWQHDAWQRSDAAVQGRVQQAVAELGQLESQGRQSATITLPSSHPLVAGETVVFRTPSNIRAVDAATGRLLWESAVIDPSYEKLVEQDAPGSTTPVRNVYTGAMTQQTPRQKLLAQRAWSDMTFGTLSSDGDLVFAVEDLGFQGPYMVRNGQRHPLAPDDFDKLMAFEISSGKLRWEIGGPRGAAELDSAGLFFLGPPLPLAGTLFCLAESQTEIVLVALDPRTGRVEWSQPLMLPETNVLENPVRRLAGLSPSYADGVLICPTAAGAVVAVDLARRTLLWRYHYGSKSVPTGNPRMIFMGIARMGAAAQQGADEEGRWLDDAPTIAGTHVLLTPRDSDELHCLRLTDGRVEWVRPRGQALYVAGVHDGNAVVVEKTQLQSWNLADGKPTWKEPATISPPSGRGLQTGASYHLPLESGELATIDLRTGRILSRSRTGGSRPPGNLVAAGGMIVSQTAFGVTGIEGLGVVQDRIAARLATNANDADALSLRGRLRLHRGEEPEGMDDLRRAVAVRPDPAAQAALVDVLLEGMRLDFATYGRAAAELEKLPLDAQQKAAYLRLHAAGLQQVGNHRAAFAEYLQLAGPSAGIPRLERLSGVLSSRSDRWLRPRIASLYAAATPRERTEMDDDFATRIRTAVDGGDAAALRRLVQCVPAGRTSDVARRALVERLDPKDDALELSGHLLALAESADKSVAGEATARLAKLLLDRKLGDQALVPLKSLQERFADVACLDGRTGRDLAAEMTGSGPAADAAALAAPWPEKALQVQSAARNQGGLSQWFELDVEDDPGAFYAGWQFQLDQQRSSVVARDAFGRERWTCTTNLPGQQIRNVYGNTIRIRGQLLVVSYSTHFGVYDLLNASGQPKLLWHRSLYEGGLPNVQMRQVMGPGGMRMIVQDQFGRPFGAVGPVTDDFVCYQVGGTIVAADARTGDVLWERRDTVRGSRLFGDGEYVFASAPGTNQAVVLRASDGEYVDTRTIPAEEERAAILGRRILAWTAVEGGQRLALVDAADGKVFWEALHPTGSAWSVARGETVLVHAPDGALSVRSIADGRILVDEKVEPLAGMSRVFLRQSGDRFVVLTYDPTRNQNANQRIMGMGFNVPLVNGPAYGFDRDDGRLAWRAEIENQALHPGHPEEVPFLMLTSRSIPVINNGRVVNPNAFHSLLLDLRNGVVAHRESGAWQTFPFRMSVDPAKHTADIVFMQRTWNISLAQGPLAPPAKIPPAARPAKPAAQGAGAAAPPAGPAAAANGAVRALVPLPPEIRVPAVEAPPR